MNTTELLDLFRSDTADVEEPFLWPDLEVLGYMNDAQRMFCRLTDGIPDASTPEVTLIDVSIGDDWVDTHPALRTVRGIVRADTGRPIEVLNYEDMQSRGLRFDGVSGAVMYLIIGMEDNRARVHPVSNEAVTLQLTVYRMPLADITDTDQRFEISTEHHEHLLLWMKARAYGKQDADTYDKRKADDFEAKFLAYCENAKQEAARRRHKPRAVMYGGL